MARNRHLENFLESDIDEAVEYYSKEAQKMKGLKQKQALHFLRYFVAYLNYQETGELPPVGENDSVTLQCLYRVEQMMITFINLRNMGRL